MKIKFLTTKLNLETGGGANYALDLRARALQEIGHEVSVITAFSQSNNFRDLPYDVHTEFMKSPDPRNNIPEIIEILKKYENQTDVYIVDGHFFMWGAAFYKKNGGKSKVVVDLFSYLESMNLFRDPGYPLTLRRRIGLCVQRIWEQIFAKKNLKYVDYFIYSSPVTISFYKKFGLPNDKAELIAPFLKIQEQKPNPAKDFRLLFVGRLVEYKGVKTLMEAMKILKNSVGGDIFLDIVGEGEEEGNLRKSAEEFGDRVIFHGFKKREELNEFYEKATVLVHPTLDPEPFGMTIVEAMNFGLPSITSEGSGSRWIADESGIGFGPGNAKALSEKILMLYNEPEELEKLRREVKERIKYFDYKKWLGRLDAILKKI